MKILILSQTPPPYHGQAIMQKYLVDAKWDWCEKKHVRLNYSEKISDVGKFGFSKVITLLTVILKVLKERLKGKIDLIYYPPAGPNRIPFYRDIITLLFIRRTTNKIVFHFHAGGINKLIEKLNPVEKIFASLSLGKPDASIVLLESLKDEIKWFQSRSVFAVPNGIPDISKKYIERKNQNPLKLLTVGLISKEKGIYDIIATANILKNKKINFEWNILGEFATKGLKEECEKLFAEQNLTGKIKFDGEITGEKKWEFYTAAHIFVFLSYASEALPVSILEAMMFSLPVVATDWRSVPEIISDGVNGFLVPVHNPVKAAEKIELLINNPEIRNTFGKEGRKIYLEKFTLEKHLAKIEGVIKQIVRNGR